MMGRWVAVPTMKLIPNKCIACGSTPRDDSVEGRPPMEAYFCEGVDYDWGKSLYLCGNCVRVLGLLRGMVDVVEHQKVVKSREQLVAELEELKAAYNEQEGRIERMLDGVRAKKEVTQARTKRSPKKRETV